MASFVINNCGDTPILVNGSPLPVKCCRGVLAPAELSSDGEYSFTITYAQEQVPAVWEMRMVDGEDEFFMVSPAQELWQPDLLVAGFALSPGERSEVIKTTKPVTISVEGV
jgi:hypothetical protein